MKIIGEEVSSTWEDEGSGYSEEETNSGVGDEDTDSDETV